MKNQMKALVVGKPYPYPNISHGNNVIIAQPNPDFFDVIGYFNKPNSKVISEWESGKISYGVYYDDQYPHIPFFLLSFPDLQMGFDVSLNMHYSAGNDYFTNWINSESNVITFRLIDASTNILKAIKVVGIDKKLSSDLKKECERQNDYYQHTSEVANAIDCIMQRVSTETMIRKTNMRSLS